MEMKQLEHDNGISLSFLALVIAASMRITTGIYISSKSTYMIMLYYIMPLRFNRERLWTNVIDSAAAFLYLLGVFYCPIKSSSIKLLI